MTGGLVGRETTRRSPYLLSVENIGASVETSHLNLPVVERLVLTRTILVLLLSS